jgi:hypothetical protein
LAPVQDAPLARFAELAGFPLSGAAFWLPLVPEGSKAFVSAKSRFLPVHPTRQQNAQK